MAVEPLEVLSKTRRSLFSACAVLFALVFGLGFFGWVFAIVWGIVFIGLAERRARAT